MVNPIYAETIKHEETEKFWDGKYIVTTIIPLVENPYKNIYVLTQEELDEFLEGYEEYAEFLVEIKLAGE